MADDFRQALIYTADVDDVVAKHRQMQRSEKETGEAADDAAKKAEDGWSRYAAGMERNSRRMKIVGAAMTAAITVPVLVGLNAAADAASDSVETVSKLQAVFGDQAAGVDAWADTAASALRMSEQAALENVGTLGNLFRAMGLSTSAAVDMSKGVVQLGADLSSFNNIATAEVLEKIRAGLVGEAEPLRSLGVNITAATTEAKALELGLAGVNGEISESAKVQARWQQILDQTTLAQGDAARTSGELAGQAAEAEARFADLQVQIGQHVLPAKRLLYTATNDVLEVITQLPGPLQAVGAGFVGVAATAGPVVFGLGQMASGMGQVAQHAPLLKAKLAGVTSFLTGPWGAALAAGTIALGLWGKSRADAAGRVESLAATLDAETGAITKNTRAHVANRLEQEAALEAASKLRLDLELVVDAALGNAAAIEELDRVTYAYGRTTSDVALQETRRKVLTHDQAAAANVLAKTVHGLARDMESAETRTGRVSAAVGDLDDTQGDAAASADDLAGGIDEVASAARTGAGQLGALTQAVREQHEAQLAAVDPAFAYLKAIGAYKEAQAELNEVLKDGESTVQDQAEAGIAVAEAYLAMEAAAMEGGRSLDDMRRFMSGLAEDGRLAEGALDAIGTSADRAFRDLDNLFGRTYRLQIEGVLKADESGIPTGVSRGGTPSYDPSPGGLPSGVERSGSTTIDNSRTGFTGGVTVINNGVRDPDRRTSDELRRLALEAS